MKVNKLAVCEKSRCSNYGCDLPSSITGQALLPRLALKVRGRKVAEQSKGWALASVQCWDVHKFVDPQLVCPSSASKLHSVLFFKASIFDTRCFLSVSLLAFDHQLFGEGFASTNFTRIFAKYS